MGNVTSKIILGNVVLHGVHINAAMVLTAESPHRGMALRMIVCMHIGGDAFNQRI